MTTIMTEEPLAAGEVAKLLTAEYIAQASAALIDFQNVLSKRYAGGLDNYWLQYASLNSGGLYASVHVTGEREPTTVTGISIEDVFAQLDKTMNPVSVAARKRAEAEKLLSEAAALENSPR